MSNNLAFNFNDDVVPRSGYLSKEEILDYVSEEDIFELVFGYKPEENDRVCSPLRADFSPGAEFIRVTSGRLLFVDWADTVRSHNDCFDTVQRYYNLPNFYQTLIFVKDHLIQGKSLIKIDTGKKVLMPREKKKTEIYFESRAYLISDKIYWERYQITKQQLLEDRVMPVSKYRIDTKDKGTFVSIAHTPCYAYTDFASTNKKLYFPYRKGHKRFLTNCSKNDIGGINHIDLDDNQLIITKSYKDYRVLKNQGYNTIWFQNEGMFPDDEYLVQMIEYFEDIIIFFDNDETGILAAYKLKVKLESLNANSVFIFHLPIFLLQEGISDPSDLLFKRSRQELLDFLNSNI